MFCYKSILDGQKLAENGEHEICVIEWDKRHAADMCTRCNKNKREHWWNVCSDCESNNSNFQGYEGPR